MDEKLFSGNDLVTVVQISTLPMILFENLNHLRVVPCDDLQDIHKPES